MVPSTYRMRQTIIAQSVQEHLWRVCDVDRDHPEGETMGTIEELGGTYEVRVLHWPSTRQYVSSFKEAMQCFGSGERAT